MIEPRSTATIRALASLAELSADQLESGSSIEDVIATLRKAAEAVRLVIDEAPHGAASPGSTEIAQDLAPMDLVPDTSGTGETDADSDVAVLNAG